MSGENVSVDNMGYSNPYLKQQYGGTNDDLMANLHFNEIHQTGRIPGLTETAGSTSFRGNPETDTFEKSGGPGFIGTAALAGGGALAGGASGYYLMNNPIKDLANKTLNPAFYQTIDKADLAEQIKIKQKALKNTTGYNLAQLAKAQSFDALPDEVKTFLKNKNLDKFTPEAAKDLIEAAGKKVEDFDLDKVAQNVTNKFKGTQYYNSIIKTSTDGQILSAINNTKNADELAELIAKHKDFFGLTGTEDEILQKAKTLAAKGKDTVTDEAGKIIRNAEDFVLKRQNKIFAQIGADGKLLENADEATKALFKDFKWQQAKKYGKWGAAIAAAGALLYSLFSGGKKQDTNI